MKIKKLQQGGMPVQEASAAPQDEMMMQIEGLAQELLSNLGAEGCAMLIEVLSAMLQQMQGPIDQTSQPVFRKGGKLSRRVR